MSPTKGNPRLPQSIALSPNKTSHIHADTSTGTPTPVSLPHHCSTPWSEWSPLPSFPIRDFHAPLPVTQAKNPRPTVPPDCGTQSRTRRALNAITWHCMQRTIGGEPEPSIQYNRFDSSVVLILFK